MKITGYRQRNHLLDIFYSDGITKENHLLATYNYTKGDIRIANYLNFGHSIGFFVNGINDVIDYLKDKTLIDDTIYACEYIRKD
jgi:SOS response regulatory protein OraA/RecX